MTAYAAASLCGTYVESQLPAQEVDELSVHFFCVRPSYGVRSVVYLYQPSPHDQLSCPLP